MASTKFIIRTQKNKIFEYEADSFIKALECYIVKVLGFNKRLKISESSWKILMETTMANSLRIACLNGLCRFPNDVITNVIKKSFVYSFESPKDGLDYKASTDYEYVFVAGCYNSDDFTANIVIADTYGGLPVTHIGTRAFKENLVITDVTIPDGVICIESEAFKGCSSLTSISLPESLTSIGSYAFDGCSSLNVVNFAGSRKQWEALEIAADNDILNTVTINCLG